MEIVGDRAWVEIATWTSPTPMGGFAAFPSPETSSEARATMARCPRRVQRDSLGAAHRRSLARSARPLSALSNLPSPLPAVAARRDPDATLARPRRRPAGPRQTGFVGDLHRRQLQFGEKRGTAVGPTRRGKGSKIMAIADGHGFPVACDVASASPHETKLVEGTLQHRFTRAWPERMIGHTAYDSDPLDRQLWREHRIRMIAPNRPNRLNLTRSEEHTSELQSRLHLVCRLLLEKKKNKTTAAPILGSTYT